MTMEVNVEVHLLHYHLQHMPTLIATHTLACLMTLVGRQLKTVLYKCSIISF